MSKEIIDCEETKPSILNAVRFTSKNIDLRCRDYNSIAMETGLAKPETQDAFTPSDFEDRIVVTLAGRANRGNLWRFNEKTLAEEIKTQSGMSNVNVDVFVADSGEDRVVITLNHAPYAMPARQEMDRLLSVTLGALEHQGIIGMDDIKNLSKRLNVQSARVSARGEETELSLYS